MNNGASEPGVIGDNTAVWKQVTAKLTDTQADSQAVVTREREFLQRANDEEKLARLYDYQRILEKAIAETGDPETAQKLKGTLARLRGLMLDLQIRVGVA